MVSSLHNTKFWAFGEKREKKEKKRRRRNNVNNFWQSISNSLENDPVAKKQLFGIWRQPFFSVSNTMVVGRLKVAPNKSDPINLKENRMLKFGQLTPKMANASSKMLSQSAL